MQKYNKGDWLVIDNLNNGDNGKIGHVFQVSNYVDSGYYYATEETQAPGRCWQESCLRPALPNEIPSNFINKESPVNNNYQIF